MTQNATFAQAVASTLVSRETTNGMQTYESSLNACVDLFFQIGSSRGKDVMPQFERAYQEDRVLALRMAAWARDVRGGAGERQIYRNVLRFIETNHINDLPLMLSVTSTYGRWDDLLVVETELGRKLAFDLIADALLVKQDGLCSKWMPRKGEVAVALRKHLKLSPKGYRKTLVSLTKVVETAMCSGNWTDINYGHVPSVAASRYQKTFVKHDAVGYTAYRDALKAGEAKVNAGALFPYDIVKSINMGGDKVVSLAQWEALPNYIGDSLVLPMVDVSGSMGCVVGGSANLTCMDVALSLGLYLADKNSGPFKDMFLTFSESSKIEVLKGDLISKLAQMRKSEWGMNTNLNSAFAEVLRVAVANKVTEANMPKYILILSDMEFDRCTTTPANTALDMIKGKFSAAGYEMPNIIFWNLNARAGNVPISYKENGTALISGFSPAIMTSVLSAENIDPVSIMLGTINADRYMAIQ